MPSNGVIHAVVQIELLYRHDVIGNEYVAVAIGFQLATLYLDSVCKKLLSPVSEKPFHIYRSSAGSGKTRVLAREYIQLALRRPDYFKHILAMTFTNKSTQEMKDRILKYLHDFTKGESTDLANEIIGNLHEEGLTVTQEQIRERSQAVLRTLLHRYAEFSVSTIDAFFQRIIRAFTRDTRLMGNFRLEVDDDLVMEEVVDLLMNKLSADDELRGWILDYCIEKLEQSQPWDIRKSLISFAGLLKFESFKSIEDEVLEVTKDKTFFRHFKQELNKTRYSFENIVFERAKDLSREIADHNLSDEDFAEKSKGVSVYIRALTAEVKKPSKTVLEIIGDPEKWAQKKSNSKALIASLARQRWQPKLSSLVNYINDHWQLYQSVIVVSKNLYSFGLLADLVQEQQKYLVDQNLMLLSDSSKFLNKLINNQDTSFLYEKVGSFYRHYLIDEFQDTSGMQWKNLLPLVQNGIAQNYKSLIVGDIKQSIYRWRGGDLSILQNQINNDVSPLLTQAHHLNTNYRSEGNIVLFNNLLFQTAAKLVSMQADTDFPTEAYNQLAQKTHRTNAGGYVNIEFLPDDTEEKFKEISLRKLPTLVEELQRAGVAMRDIAFLVRDHKDGKRIATRFIEYRSNEAKDGFNYEVVSNESLLLFRASSVVVIINALTVLHSPTDNIARAQLAYEYQKLWHTPSFTDWNNLFTSIKHAGFAQWVPADFVQQQSYLASLSLFEMVENIIHIFHLGQLKDEIIYIQTFQDYIQEFSNREQRDLGAFLEWWEENREKKSIQVPSGVDAAQIITIHKSKGLQFQYVVLPFLSWELEQKGTVAPTLWVRSNQPPFKNAGNIPVKYTRDLCDSFFEPYYHDERERNFLDNLNLLYVAFTRAEAGLIAYASDPKKKQNNTVGDLVWNAIHADHDLLAMWNANSKRLVLGNVAAAPSIKRTERTVSLQHYTVTQWRQRLALRQTGAEYFQVTDKRKKINYGIMLHSMLANVQYDDGWKQLLQRHKLAGTLADDEAAELDDMLDWLMREPLLQFSFGRDAIHKTETSIFTGTGTEKRIDRVSVQGQTACVLDYKTGQHKSDDEEQVKEYCNLMVKMGYTTTTGLLVYLNEKRVVQV